MHINNYSIKCSVGDKGRDIFIIWTSFPWKLIEALTKAMGLLCRASTHGKGAVSFGIKHLSVFALQRRWHKTKYVPRMALLFLLYLFNFLKVLLAA